MNHRSRVNQRVKTEAAGKVDHRIIMNQFGWWLGLTPGLKDLRRRLKERGYMGMEHGTRLLKADPVGVQAGSWTGADMEPGQSVPSWSLGGNPQTARVRVGQELVGETLY